MPYEKQNFVDGMTLTAGPLNAMDDQIAKNEDDISYLRELIEYVKINIDTLTVSVSTAELGTTQEVTVNYKTNKAPTSIRIKAGNGSWETMTATQNGSKTFSLSASTTFTLEASDGKNTVTKTVTTTFKRKNWYGVSDASSYTSAWMTGLIGTWADNYKMSSVTVNATSGQYIFFCTPFSGTPTFMLGGFATDFDAVGTVSYNGANYNVYRSTRAGLGTMSLEVR